jgi:hypothetical protein
MLDAVDFAINPHGVEFGVCYVHLLGGNDGERLPA